MGGIHSHRRLMSLLMRFVRRSASFVRDSFKKGLAMLSGRSRVICRALLSCTKTIFWGSDCGVGVRGGDAVGPTLTVPVSPGLVGPTLTVPVSPALVGPTLTVPVLPASGPPSLCVLVESRAA